MSQNSLHLRFLQASKTIDKLLKNKGEQEKRKRNVQKMQKDAVSDNEEDEEAAEQMAANAKRQAQTLQAEDGDPEPEVLQQVLFPQQQVCAFTVSAWPWSLLSKCTMLTAVP